jgi:hypothetical protein
VTNATRVRVQAPPPPEPDELQALIEEARRRARSRRRRNGVVAVAVALVITGGSLLVSEAARDHAPTASAVVGSSSDPISVGAGPFWYMRTIGTMLAPRCAKPLPGIMNPCAAMVRFRVVMSTETWVGADGTMRERRVEVSQRFASPADRARWLATGRPVPVPVAVEQGDALDIDSGHFPSPMLAAVAPDVPPIEGPPAGAGPVDVGDGLFTYDQLLALPASGAPAIARIDRAWAELRHRYGAMLLRWHSPGAAVVARADLGPIPDQGRAIQTLTMIALLDAAPVPERVRIALLAAAIKLPGVTVMPVATVAPVAPAARGALRVSASYPRWQPVSFVFDRRTGEVLTGQPVDGGPPDIAGPPSTVVVQGVVGSITALPRGIHPIPGVSAPPLWPAPPAPPAEAVYPAVGGPRTVYTALLAAPAGDRGARAPTAWLGLRGSAGQGVYRGANRAFDRCLPTASRRVWPAATIHRAGRLVFAYRFAPRSFGLRAWCPGRYQLGIQAFPNPLPPHFTTPPYTGASGTSLYFEVR